MKEGVDKEKEPSPLRDVLLHERKELHTWKETVEIRPPNLLVPRQIASHVNAQPLCKLAVSPKGDYIAVMSHRRNFQMFKVTEDEKIVAESSVQILEDASAEYCIFEFSASGTLLLSTRSDASIDVFDRLAEHCYTMMPALAESSPDLVSAISSISSYSLMASEDKFSDYMTALHYNCTLSAYKMGRSSYFKLFTVLLESPLTGVCRLLPSHGMLLVTTHYRIGTEDIPGGLASYRIVQGTPHVVPIVAPKYEKDWWESLSIRLPFASSFAYISSLAVDATESQAVGVSTTGDVFLFSLPSLTLLSTLNHVSKLPRPRTAVFVHCDELSVLFSSGRLVRCHTKDPEQFVQKIAEGDESSSEVEVYSSRTQLVVPAERELYVLQSEGGPEVAISSQRSSLAARLFMLTIWRSLKQLLGMAVGDAAAPLQQATQLLSLEFSLWYAPIVTLEEQLEKTLRQSDFVEAIKLADKYKEYIHKDTVYKRQWIHVCDSGKLTTDHVKNILGRIGDHKWKAERCLQTTTSNMEVQRELVKEGILLREQIPLPFHVRLAHHGRLLAVMDDVEMYLEMREWPLEKVAEGLAERGSLVALERLLVSNWSSLRDKSLEILSCLPASIEPKRYERIVPTIDGTLIVGEESNDFVAELERIRRSGEEGRKEVDKVDRGEKDQGEEEKTVERNMDKWAEARARTIETETGIVPYSIQMVDLCKRRGCKTLDDALTRWNHLDQFIHITRNVTASLDFLQSASVSLLGQHFAVLDDASLISNLPSIIELLQWHSPSEYEHVVRGIVIARTTTSTRVLHELMKERPEMVDGDMMIEALSSLTLTGKTMLNEMEKIVKALKEGKERKQIERMREALRTLEEKNVHPTFGKLIASQTDGLRAREVLSQLVHCHAGEKRDEEGWRRVADDVLRLSRMLYADLLSEEEAMEMVAERFLLDADLLGEEGGPPLPLSTLLTVDGEETRDRRRLSAERSAGLLLRLADSFIASSVSGHDEQLGRARVLADAAKITANKESLVLVRSLDVIGLAADLGSGRLPIQIKHADPQTLLEECIGNGDNYKKGKRCAKLAQLLRVDTPVATAFASCALHAVERGDEHTLAQYIQEISSARNLPVVHTLCMRLLATPLLHHMRASIEGSAVANAAEEELEEVLAKISSLRLEMEESMMNYGSMENKREERSVERKGDEGKEKEEEKREHVPLDPYYTKAERQEGTSNVFGDWRREEERNERRRREARLTTSSPLTLFATESASAFAAAAMLSAAKEAEEAIEDERLRRYTSALRQLLPRLSGRLVEGVTPRKMIERAIVMDEGSTALDRLEAHGCSRERFVEDVEYRLDTIDGLAMMEGESSWSDAIELAAQFGIDESRVHLASMENILTTLSPSSARSLIALRGHTQALRKDGETIRRTEVQLRKSVLPLLKDDDERYLLYLEQFSSTSIESILLPLLIHLRDNCGVDKLHSILLDETRLARAIERVKMEDADEVAGWLREIPGTSSACEAAARSMMAEKADPQRFLSLIRDPSMLIELLGDVSIDLEGDIDWLLQYARLPSEMRDSLTRHRDEMFGGGRKQSEERREDSPFSDWGGWGEENGGGGGGLTMRRRGQ